MHFKFGTYVYGTFITFLGISCCTSALYPAYIRNNTSLTLFIKVKEGSSCIKNFHKVCPRNILDMTRLEASTSTKQSKLVKLPSIHTMPLAICISAKGISKQKIIIHGMKTKSTRLQCLEALNDSNIILDIKEKRTQGKTTFYLSGYNKKTQSFCTFR